MQILKSDIINDAYSALRISGVTIIPGPEENKLALGYLEAMAAEWEGQGYRVGYKFEALPDTGDPSGVELRYRAAFSTGLALRLAPDFGKVVPETLYLMHRAAFSALAGGTAFVEPTDYPYRMPRGSGSYRSNRWQRFYIPETKAPATSATVYLAVGDVDSYVEGYESYIDAVEEVVSISTEITTGISLVSGALDADGTRYEYSIKALAVGFNQIKITATTDAGRVDVRRVNFQVSE